MKDEIKEKIKAYYVANDIDEILDYITNLQEENEKFKEYARSYLKSKIDRKNEELELIKTKFIEEHNQCYDYKSRIEKAIEDIQFCLKSIYQEKEMSTDERTRTEMESCIQIFEETLRSLQGVDKDE